MRFSFLRIIRMNCIFPHVQCSTNIDLKNMQIVQKKTAETAVVSTRQTLDRLGNDPCHHNNNSRVANHQGMDCRNVNGVNMHGRE